MKQALKIMIFQRKRTNSILFFFLVVPISFMALTGCGQNESPEDSASGITENISVTVNGDSQYSSDQSNYQVNQDGWWNTTQQTGGRIWTNPLTLPENVTSVNFSASQNSVVAEVRQPEVDEITTSEFGVLTGDRNRRPEDESEALSGETTALELSTLSDAELIERVGPMLTENQRQSGILASVSLAQFLLESAHARSELALDTNNCFGMKCDLLDDSFPGSTWDGRRYNKATREETIDGISYNTHSDFRVYDSVEDSIADHSAYLSGAERNNEKQYAGLIGEQDYRRALQIIKDGGYATDTNYVNNACSIIERYDLTQYDISDEEL